MKEEWKPINDYEDLYEVSNLGRVKSIRERIFYGDRKNLILKAHLSRSTGYYGVTLCRDKFRVYKDVHTLVAKAFIPNPENKKYVNHKNSIRNDNSSQNLEWCTQSENIIHSFESTDRVQIGKLNYKQFLLIMSHPDVSTKDLSKMLNLTVNVVYKARKGMSYKKWFNQLTSNKTD